MAILDIVMYPDPRLKQASPEVEAVTEETRRHVADLIDTMHATPGVGVAAPQVGLMQRIVVIDVTGKAPGQGLLILINPIIQRIEDMKVQREGCLSIPEFTAAVKRGQKVWLSAQDLDGNRRDIYAEGLEAIAVQHEQDHLDGILFLDRVVSLKTDLFRRKAYTPPPGRVELVVAAIDGHVPKIVPTLETRA